MKGWFEKSIPHGTSPLQANSPLGSISARPAASLPQGTKRVHAEDRSDKLYRLRGHPQKARGGSQAGVSAERNEVTHLKSHSGVSTSVRSGIWRKPSVHPNAGECRLKVLSSGACSKQQVLGVRPKRFCLDSNGKQCCKQNAGKKLLPKLLAPKLWCLVSGFGALCIHRAPGAEQWGGAVV